MILNKTMLNQLKQHKERDKTIKKGSFIIFGAPKVGKTTLVRTFPQPIWVDSFDPDGGVPLNDMELDGTCIVNSIYETDNPDYPKAFNSWKTEFQNKIRSNFFQHVGTYVLDSYTTFEGVCSDAIVHRNRNIVKATKRSGNEPQLFDYRILIKEIQDLMKMMVALPCNVVLIGHENAPKDASGNVVGDLGLSAIGQLVIKLSGLFSETYRLVVKDTKTGSRVLQPLPKYRQITGSRLDTKRLLKAEEFTDFEKIFKKLGLPYEHKPSFFELIEQAEREEVDK